MRNGLPIKDPLTTLLSRSACVVCILLFLAFNSYAQSEGQTIPHRGFQPTDSYALGNIETINTTSGNLMLNIPLASLPPGRGGSPGFQLGLHYNSKIWNGQSDVTDDPNHSNNTIEITRLVHSTQGGWAYNLKSYSVFAYNRNSGGVTYPINDCRHNNIWKLKVTFPDGGTHEFQPYGYDDPCDDGYFGVPASAAMTYYSIDGTYARLVYDQSGWTLSFPDGTHVVDQPGSQRSYDRNGNYTEIQSVANYNNTGHQAKVITDQLGRFIAVEFGVGEDYVHATGFNGEPLTTTVKWTSSYVKKTYRAGNHFQYNLDINNAGVGGVGEILLPAQLGANLKYSFGYNGWPTSGNTTPSIGWGELSSVTLPSGARADYQYEMDNHSGSGQQADLVLKNAPTQKELNYNLEYDGSAVAAPTERWLYSISETYAQITSPDGGIIKEWFTDTDLPGGGLVYKVESPDGSVLEKVWKENRPYLPPGVTIWAGERVNSYVSKEFASIRDAAGNLIKTAIKEYRHDKNGNMVQQFEYDWAPYSSVPRDGSNNPIGTIPGDAPLKRLTTTSYYAATPDASDTTTADPETYDKASAPFLRVAVASNEIGDGLQVLARSEVYYDNELTTGNVTQQRSWDSTTGGYISVSHQYDGYFNRTLSTDARGHQTMFIYGAVGAFTDLYPTEIISAVDSSIKRTMRRAYDFNTGLVTQTTDVDNNASSETDYDVFGRAIETRAAANVANVKTVARVEYSAVDRRVITRSDLNAAYDGKLVSIQHYDQLGRVRLARQLEDSATQNPYNETQGIKVQTRYKYSDVNSYQVSSQPYREAASAQAPTLAMGWSRAKADSSGRLMESQQFAGTTLPAPWSGNTTGIGKVISTYDANTNTIVDQAGKVRRSVTDALGRLVRVDEPDQNNNLDVGGVPFQSTSYTYDALDNLITVTQGTQTRTFAFDSLKRLKSATNPESGTTCYGTVTSGGQCQADGYDANGNLIYKTDSRLVRTTYVYDELNRNTSISYSNDPENTPTVTRSYDGAMNGIGRLWKTETSGATGSRTTIGSYDALGRPTSQSQQFYNGAWSAAYTVSATYNLAGQPLTMTYPSLRRVNYNYDSSGRLADKDGTHPAFSGNLGGVQRTYASEFEYTAMGGLQQEKFGSDTPLYHKQRYNERGQLWDMRLSTVPFSSDPANGDRGSLVNYYSDNFIQGGTNEHNNGNLLRQEIYIPGSGFFQQNFAYDSLNRLTSISEKLNGSGVEMFKQSYLYDRYGNRRLSTNSSETFGGVNNLDFEVQTSSNRLYALGDLALTDDTQRRMQYDPAGNLKRDSYTGAGDRSYNAENRMTKAWGGNNQLQEYTYNGDGQRVRRKVDSATTWQVYGISGELLAEYAANVSAASPQKEYGYRNGQLLITAVPQAPAPNTIGLYDPATGNFFLKNANTPGNADFIVGYGVGGAGWLPLTGDWNSDGTDTIGLYDPPSGLFFLKNANTPGDADLVFGFGPVGLGWLPLIGDWDGDGLDTIGLYDPASGNFYLKNTNSGGNADTTVAFGPGGMGRKPLAADWDGDGIDSIGLYDPASGNFSLKNANTPGNADLIFVFGAGGTGWTAIAGDWNSDGLDTIGLYAPATGNFYLKNANTSGNADLVFAYGPGGLGWKPVTGNWGAGGGGSTTNIQWLVTDQIGTPRLVFDKSGSLAGVSRHDYLPFGEDIAISANLRTNTLGYNAGDSVRQKFTQEERDNETGLDYFLARYYSSVQGRFTSVDPEQAGARNQDPQSWNGYAYAGNSPLVYIDPDGRDYRVCDANGRECVTYSDNEFDRFLKGAGAGNDYSVHNGNIYYQGELTATYSNSCALCSGLVGGMAERGPAVEANTRRFVVAAVILGVTGGTGAYVLGAGGTVTTLGIASRAAPAVGAAGGFLSQLSRTDARIFQRALDLGASAQNAFMNNVAILRDATFQENVTYKINIIGKIGNSPVFGSIPGKVGIAEVNGVTVVVRMTNGNPTVLGPLN